MMYFCWSIWHGMTHFCFSLSFCTDLETNNTYVAGATLIPQRKPYRREDSHASVQQGLVAPFYHVLKQTSVSPAWDGVVALIYYVTRGVVWT